VQQRIFIQVNIDKITRTNMTHNWNQQ